MATTITPKYYIGQEVYFIHDDEIKKSTITKIYLTIDSPTGRLTKEVYYGIVNQYYLNFFSMVNCKNVETELPSRLYESLHDLMDYYKQILS